MMNDYSEDALIEQPAIALFAELGWETVNCFRETLGAQGTLGRETRAEVVLVPRLRAALRRLNPALPGQALDAAVEELTRDRSALAPAQANREVYRLLRDGVKVTYLTDDDEDAAETVRVIDWREPARNDYLLASQLWIAGEMYTRRADLVGFVNGLPLVFVELKAAHKRLDDAYNDNLRDYKDTIPQVFWYNALIILSNGSRTRIGSMTASWEHFAEWKRVDDEREAGVISLETAIRGTCPPDRLLDIVENFTLYSDAGGRLVKLVARNHQYLGVNNAVAALARARDRASAGGGRPDKDRGKGRLGVFWHTQGSGKSYSMVFFAQKVLRTLPGNWTFLIVTDRLELDDQIYKTFAAVGSVTEKHVQAGSGDELRLLLSEDHRYIFTLIQKFHAPKGETHPMLSNRSDIIVMADEAHRSQYDIFALNMGLALPKAAFIGFTGTPLIAGEEERTREVFGDYVSVYNFKQSVDDGSTVPLYYENRIPELQLTNADLNRDMEDIVEAADLDEAQEQRLQREFARQYHLITREDRLERIAEDIVAHFMSRGQSGKAMVVSIDKATAVRMYDRVRAHWLARLAALRQQLQTLQGSDDERRALAETVAYMQGTDMAVVVSQAQNEVRDFRDKGLDIAPHRRRMLKEDLDKRFKDPNDPLRIVFVCAMWMTGFDVPSISTIYLDKPMRNHTLMQTIARANRVFEGKLNGLIVDYVGVFRDLQKALAIYGSMDRTGGDDETPVKDKSELVDLLKRTIAELEGFCAGRGIDPRDIMAATGFERVRLLDDAVEAIVARDEDKNRYLGMTAAIGRIYRAILPDAAASDFGPLLALLGVLAAKIAALTPTADISGVMDDVEQLLNSSIATDGYVIREAATPFDATKRVNLAALDLDALKARFEQGRKHTATQQLRGAITSRLTRMVRLNRSRADYLDRFQRLIDDYNSGAVPVEELFTRLVALAHQLDAEEQRTIAESLSEEELALFDLLTKPEPVLAEDDAALVKRAARDLLVTLKREKLVLDWRKRQQSRAQVLTTIETLLDQELPRAYTPDIYHQKCDAVYQHIYDSYYGQGKSIYGSYGSAA